MEEIRSLASENNNEFDYGEKLLNALAVTFAIQLLDASNGIDDKQKKSFL